MKPVFLILGLVLSLSLVSADDFVTVSQDDAQNNADIQSALSYGLNTLLGKIGRKRGIDTSSLTQNIQNIAVQNGDDGTDYKFEVYLIDPAGDLFVTEFVVHSDTETGNKQVTESHFNYQQASTFSQSNAEPSSVQLLTAQVEKSSLVQDLFNSGLEEVISSAISSNILPAGTYTAKGDPIVFKRSEGDVESYSFDVDAADENGDSVHIAFGLEYTPSTGAKSIVNSSFTTVSTETSEITGGEDLLANARARNLRSNK